jgi:hypothetical protein
MAIVLADCIKAFESKVNGVAEVSVSGPFEDGHYNLLVDNEPALIMLDGTIECASVGLTASLAKHFAPYIRAQAKKAKAAPISEGPSELPKQDLPEEEPAGDFRADEETPAVEVAQTPTPTVQGSAAATISVYGQIVKVFGHDLCEVIGETGTMKTIGLFAMAMAAAKEGKRVLYLDTENNCGPEGAEELKAAGVMYHYTPVLSEIDKIIMKDIAGRKDDLIIIDSVGMPILRQYATLGQKQRGDALLMLIAWFGRLKEITFQNKSVAFVSNQQASEFGKTDPKERGDYRMGFGDKANYIPGCILLAKKSVDAPGGSKASWNVWRVRRKGWGVKVFNITASDAGSTITMDPGYMTPKAVA